MSINQSGGVKAAGFKKAKMNLGAEAQVLMENLNRGLVNIPELNSFLNKVVVDSEPTIKKKKSSKRNERFMQQLQNLEKGRSGKPNF